MQIWNFSICLYSYKNNILKISHCESKEFSSYSPVKFVFFLKGRLLFNVRYCVRMFVNKHFAYLKCPYLKKWKVLWCGIWIKGIYTKLIPILVARRPKVFCNKGGFRNFAVVPGSYFQVKRLCSSSNKFANLLIML